MWYRVGRIRLSPTTPSPPSHDFTHMETVLPGWSLGQWKVLALSFPNRLLRKQEVVLPV